MWSSAHISVIEELIRTHGSLNAQIYHEKSNQADSQACAIVVNQNSFVVGGETTEKGQIVGYIARTDSHKPELFKEMMTKNAPIDACELLLDDNDEIFLKRYEDNEVDQHDRPWW